MKKVKLPRDPSQRAKAIVDLVTAEADESATPSSPEKDPAAVSLGRKGGLKGGVARAKALGPKKRSEIASKAAKARWKKKRDV